MRMLLVLLISCLFSGCLVDAHIKSNKEQDGLQGSVRTVRVEKTLCSKVGTNISEGQGSREVSQVTYNVKGNKTEEAKYGVDGSLISRSIFTYDAAEQLIEVKVQNADDSISLKRAYKHIPSRDGKKVEEAVFKDGTTLLTKAVSVYDQKGRVIELATYDPSGIPSIKQIISYDASGQLIEIDYYQGNNSLMGKSVFLYDTHGTLKEKIDYSAAGPQSGRTVFSKEVKEEERVDVSEYDADSNLLKRETYVRKFDSHGNWIKETTSKWNSITNAFEPLAVTYRTIAYY